MPIENRNLKPGTRLVARYHKQQYTGEVIGEEGKLRFRLADGREFKSPSAAGMAITGKSCNGWAFWSVATEAAPATETQTDSPAAETAPTTDTPPAAAEEHAEEQAAAPITQETAPAKKSIFKLPNQKGAPEGQTRWYCRTCSKSFLSPADHMPTTCPWPTHKS